MSDAIERGITVTCTCPHCNGKIKVGIPKKTAKAVLHAIKTGQNVADVTLIWEASK